MLPLAIAGSAVLVGILAGYEPRLALGFAIGLVFAVVTLTNLTAGLCVFAIFTFIDEVVPSGGVPLTKLLGVLLILSWLAAVTAGESRRRELFESNGLLALILLFVTWTALSMLWAADAGEAADAIGRYAPNALLFLVVYAAVRTRSQAMLVVGALLIGAVIAGAYGVASPLEADAGGRLSGSFGNANETGAVLAVGVALAGGLAFALRGHPAPQLATMIGAPFCALALFLTVSRGGIVALAAILVAGVFVAGPRRGTVASAAALGALMAVVYFGAFAGQQEREHLLQSDNGTGRTDIWKVGWRMVEANPAVGVGAGNFQSSSVHYLLEPGAIERADFIVDEPKVAHNTYLGVLAELGVVGLALFLAILGASLASLWRAARAFGAGGDREMEMLSRAVLIALVGFLTAAFFGSREYSNQLWLLLALGPALLGLARAELDRRGAPPEELQI